MLVKSLDFENYLQIKDVRLNINDLDNYLRRFSELKSELKIREELNFFSEYWIYIVGGVERKILFPDELLMRKVADKYGKTYSHINIGYRYFILEKMVDNSRISSYNTLIKKIFVIGIDGLKDLIKRKSIPYLKTALECFEFLELSDADEIAKLLYYQYDNCDVTNKSRKLSNLSSIFEFTEIINEFLEIATMEELKVFYPIILWWKITTIIPLRPSEFLTTDYNCLIKDNNRYYLKVRRSKSKERILIENISNIEDFYREDIVEINKNTHELIENYMKFVDINIPKHKKELLISGVYLLNRRNEIRKRELNKDTFTSFDFWYLLNRFYTEIVGLKMGKVVVDKNDKNVEDYKDLDNYIGEINPYDTRHIAIINLIIMGNEPLTVMKLAGHSKIGTTEGYYNHIEEYANAYSISYARQLKKKLALDSDFIQRENNSSEITMNLIINKNKYIQVDGGRCTYTNIVKNDFSKCYLVEGNHLICPYFIADDINELIKQDKKCRENISNQLKVLKELVSDMTNSIEYSKRYAILSEQIRQEISNLCIVNSKMVF